VISIRAATLGATSFLLLAVSVQSSAMAPSPAAKMAGGAAACSRQDHAVLTAVLNEIGGKTASVLSDAPLAPFDIVHRRPELSERIPVNAESEIWHSGWTGRPPSASLVKRWLGSMIQSGASCFGRATAFKPSGGSTYGRVSANGTPEPDIRVSMPTRDIANKQALVLFSQDGPGLAGMYGFLLLEQTKAGWRKVGIRILSVS